MYDCAYFFRNVFFRKIAYLRTVSLQFFYNYNLNTIER